MGWLGSLLTIVGTAVGAYLGGPWGAAIGSAIGGYVGSVVDPMKAIDPPTIGEIKAMGADEGDPMQRVIGRDVRVAADCIWRGPQWNKEPGVEGHPTNVFMPLCFSFGRTFTGLPIKKVIEVLANGHPVYWDYDEVNITGDDIAAALKEISAFNPGTGTSSVVQRYLDLTSTGTSLIGLDVGRDSVVAGYTSAGNNGTWRVVEATGLTARLKSNTDALHLFVTEAAGDDISLFQVADIGGVQDGGLTTVEISLGTPDQTPPAAIVAYEGAANVPGYAGEILVTFNNFPLDPFGFSVPRIEARLRERDDTDLPTALKDIAVGMGIDECEVDTIDAAGIFYGFATRGPKSLQDVLSPFLIAYNLVTQEKDMTLRILHRLAATPVTLLESALAAQDVSDGEPISPFNTDREDPKRLPSEVEISYMDRNRRGEMATQPYRRVSMPLDNVMQISLALVLDTNQARNIARRVCFSEAVSSERHGFALPPSMLDTFESDRVFSESHGRERTTLLTRKLIGNSYLLEFEGRRDDPAMYENENAAGGTSEGFTPTDQPTVDPIALALDIPPLVDDDVSTPLLRLGAVRESPQQVWSHSEIHESQGGPYSLVEIAESEATAGLVVGTVPTGPVGYWDLGTTITVDISGGLAPSTSTDAAVLAGAANWFQVGGEILGAVTVALVSEGRYTLSRLLRGLMDTANQVGTHAANERLVRVRPFGAMVKRTYPETAIGTVRSYDACPIADEADGVQAATVTLNGSTIRPFSGAQAEGIRHDPATNDWTVPWRPRTRRPLWPLFTAAPFDMVEAVESYEVEVYSNGSYAVIERTITATASGNGSVVDTSTALEPFFIYDAADQTADFGGVQTTLFLRIYQIGDSGLYSKPFQVQVP